MTVSCSIDFDDILADHWYYHILVSVANCIDFILSIVMLIEVDKFDSAFWFWWLLFIVAISRVTCSIVPFTLYTSTVPRMETGAFVWRAYSAVMLFFFSPFHSLYHAGFKNDYLLNLLCLRERTHYKDLYTSYDRHKSSYQVWVLNAVKMHIFHSYPHCWSQAIPQCLLYYCIIVYHGLTFHDNKLIFCIFFWNLCSILVTAPIWSCHLYYALSIGREHYHIWTLVYNTFAPIVDLMGVLYLISYVYDDLRTGQWPSYNASDDPAHRIIYVLWWYQFCFVCGSAILSGIIIGFVSLGYVLWDIFKGLHSFKCQEICGGCLTIAWSILVAPIAAIQCIFWMLNGLIVLNICSLSWITALTCSTIQRFGTCSHPILWSDMIEWIKSAKHKNDLVIRLSCCNYHLSQKTELKQRIQQGILDGYTGDIDLGFGDIRIHSVLSDFSWFQFVNIYFAHMTSMPRALSLALRLCLLVFGIPYILSRIIVILIPLVAFVMLHYNQWDNFMTFLSFIYSLILVVMVYLMDKVLWHSWILMHICPATRRIDSIGLHDSYMPDGNTLYAIKTSYQNIQDALEDNHKIKDVLSECIQLNGYHKNEDGLILCAPLKIINNVIQYLPGKSAYVDYVKVGNKDNVQNPLLSVDTTFFYNNEGTI
eukprot:1125449_1